MKNVLFGICWFTLSKSLTRKLLAACAIGFMTTIAVADTPPVQLRIKAPNSNGGLALLSESGWPLTVVMVVDFPDGEDFPVYVVQPSFPTRSGGGFLIFEDPDGCLNPPAPYIWPLECTEVCGYSSENPHCDSPAPPLDELFMEFTPDVDKAGVNDPVGNLYRRAALLDSAGSRGPEFQRWNRDPCVPGTNAIVYPNDNCIRVGPNTGGEVTDGFGFGADDDLPGLVIIAEYGVGRVFDEPDFELSDPIGAVNLAGLVNSVSYELSDLNKETIKEQGAKGMPTEVITEQARVWAHLNMDRNVLRHLIQYDDCTGVVTETQDDMGPGWGYCDGNDLWRVDGGPLEQSPTPRQFDFEAAIYDLESTTYTLKVFLVSGQAPDRLFDEDGDGDVDSSDAVAAGYTLLSNEDHISLLQQSAPGCFNGSYIYSFIPWDFDDNGMLRSAPTCPAGPGTISRPPR